MNPDQLGAFFQAHKPVVLGTAAAAVAGVALLKRRQSAGAKSTGATAATGSIVPLAGSVAPGSGYDSSVTDLYGALQPELEAILQAMQGEHTQQTGAGGSGAVAPAPTKSPIFTPTLPTVPTGSGGIPLDTRPGGGRWVTGALSDPNKPAFFLPPTPTGSYQTAGGQTITTHADQPGEQAQWNQGSDGLYHNQWGQTAQGINKYGSPTFG